MKKASVTLTGDDHNHTDEEHSEQAAEMYEKILSECHGYCNVAAGMAVARCLYEVVLAGYPEHKNEKEVIEEFAHIMATITDNLNKAFKSLGEEVEVQSGILDTQETKH